MLTQSSRLPSPLFAATGLGLVSREVRRALPAVAENRQLFWVWLPRV